MYAKYNKEEAGTFRVDTPMGGTTLIKGMDEQMAYNITRVINKAYQDGVEHTRANIREALGIEPCNHD